MNPPQCGVNLDGSVRDIICPFGYYGGHPHIGVCRSCQAQTAEAVAYNWKEQKPLLPCSYRVEREDVLPCCKKRRLFCDKANVFVQSVMCRVCQSDPTWLDSRLKIAEGVSG